MTETAQTPAKSVFSRMSDVLGLQIGSETDVLRVVAQGISAQTYRRVAATLRFPANLIASERTVRRRLAGNTRFSEAESERVVRLARVYAEAVGLFGDEKTALSWFTTPGEFVHGQKAVSPMTLSLTDVGARLMESRITRTAFGFF